MTDDRAPGPNTDPDPEQIPDDLLEREQWLYWNADADKPRKPLATPAADHGASWSDPGEWLDASTALEGADAVDSAGIGYVTAADNPDYPRGVYGVIDIDGGADEDDTPKDWLPSLQPFADRDAYIEWSPSHTEAGDSGLHIPIAGLEIPEWWTDQHFSDDEHEGVEVLTHKFSTFTGDPLKGAGEDVVDYGDWVDDWLREAYIAITGEDPLEEDDGSLTDESGDGTPASGDEWLTEEYVREALEHVDPDVDYETWRDIGFALEDFFTSTNTALRVFTDWSRGGTKWDDDAEEYAERIIKDGGSGRGRRTIATVVHHAKRGGWDASAARARAANGGGTAGPSYPVYDVLEESDIELHVIPQTGKEVRLAIKQNGREEFTEVQDRGFWTSGTKRGQIAGRVADALTGVDQQALRQGVKDALNQLGVDAETADDFDDQLRSRREQSLRDRTIDVVCHPGPETAEWTVTMEPGPDSPAEEPRELTFDEGDLNDGSAGSFRNLHLAKFYTKVEIDANEWESLTDYWLSIAEIREPEPDHERETAVDKFIDWVSTMRVWADEDGFEWSDRNGFYAEDYHDGADAILVPGQKITDWMERENIDVNLSRELRKEGVLVCPTDRETIGGTRRRVWPVDAERTSHTAESAHTVADDDEEDKPEGLR